MQACIYFLVDKVVTIVKEKFKFSLYQFWLIFNLKKNLKFFRQIYSTKLLFFEIRSKLVQFCENLQQKYLKDSI